MRIFRVLEFAIVISLISAFAFAGTSGDAVFEEIAPVTNSGGGGNVITQYAPVEVINFPHFFSVRAMNITSDGSYYYGIGYNAALETYELNGTFVQSVTIPFSSVRSIFYNPADGNVYAKPFGSDLWQLDPATGSGSIVYADMFQNDNAGATLDPATGLIYEHYSSDVWVYDIATGNMVTQWSGAPGYIYPITTNGVHLFFIDQSGGQTYVYDFDGTNTGETFITPDHGWAWTLAYTFGPELLFVGENVGSWYGHSGVEGGPPPDDDIAAVSIDAPGWLIELGETYTPMATFRNVGGLTQTFDVWYEIWKDGSEVYNNQQTVTSLDPGTPVQVSFADFVPGDGYGVYELTAFCEPDDNNDNNQVTGTSQAFEHVYFEDFESWDGMFVGDNDWQWGTPTSGPNAAYSGVNLWATILDGNYTNSTLSQLVTPNFGLEDDAQLSFYHWYDIEASYDGGNVKISSDGGSNWVVIDPEGGYTGTANSANPLYPEPIFTGHVQGYWEMETFDLAAYGGENVIFRFDFGADGSVNYPGWYIDDFMVLGGSRQDSCLSCDMTILTPYVADVNGYLLFDLEVTNCGAVPVDVTAKKRPIIGDCASGSVVPIHHTRVIKTDLAPGETFVGQYFFHIIDVSAFNLSLCAMEFRVSAGAGWLEACCDEFTFYHQFGRPVGSTIDWGTGWHERPDDMQINIPTSTALGQNYPNPFNATTSIPVDLADAGNVNLKVYNLSGQLVETLVDGYMDAGSHIIRWDASTISSGVYFYKLQANNIAVTKRMNLLK